MHRHECNTHNFLFNLENQTKDFSYTIFPVKKNKCWKNFKIMRKSLFNYSFYSHPEIGNFRVWHLATWLQRIIFRGTHWIRFWMLLQKEERTHIIRRCRILEIMLMESNGWSFSNIIAFTWCLTLFQRYIFLVFLNVQVYNKKKLYA
jgi:hypothetical protein